MMPFQRQKPSHVLETRYAGRRFRSRLEARWALFLTEVDVEWEYEPDSFTLPSGAYMPDFRIIDFVGGPVWLEIKPPEAHEDPRWAELAEFTERPVFVARGMPTPSVGRLIWPDRCGISAYFGLGTPQLFYQFCYCPACYRVGIEEDGRGDLVCRQRCCAPDAHNINATNPLFTFAYNAALSERFGT